jgi:IS5 family transposase
MEEALYEIASLRSFARLSLNEPIPDETTILNFRHLLEANDLADDILRTINALLARKGLLPKRGSIVDATIIAAPSRAPRRTLTASVTRRCTRPRRATSGSSE